MRSKIELNAVEAQTPRLIQRSKVAACIASMSFATSLAAAPVSPEVVHGNASFIQQGNHLEITNSNGAIINWQEFSIAANESVNFLQTHASSAILNRVISNIPSDVLGELTSNGRVFVINPNGLVIGKDATIDTAGFVASTLDIADKDFIAGRMKFVGDSGEIENHGYIAAGPGGEIVLIAPNVENHGVIEADDGNILLAAGREVVLHSMQSGGLSYKVSAPGDRALNIGQLIAKNGSVKVFADSIFQQGTVSANRATRGADGIITLEADSSLDVSGNISASGEGVEGGDIHLLGDQVGVSNANIDASGEGGGEILIGGDYQGDGTVKNAQNTNTDAATVIRADGGVNGAGGRVIVWSDDTTNSFAKITARGGSTRGDGGFVETSGKKVLDFGQPADVSATNGAAGTWLLDPEDIVIDEDHADSISTSLNGGSNVEVRTSDEGDGEGNITVEAPITKTEGESAVSLTLDAHNRVDVNAPITTEAGPLNVNIKTGRKVASVDTTEETESLDDDQDAVADDSTDTTTETDDETTDVVTDVVADNTDESEAEETSGEETSGDDGWVIAEASADETQSTDQVVEEDSGASDEVAAETAEETVEEVVEETPEDSVEEVVEEIAEEAPEESVEEATELAEELIDDLPQEEVVAETETESIDEPETDLAQESTSEADAFVDESDQQIVIAADIYTGGGEISISAGEEGDVIIVADVSTADNEGDTAGDITVEGERIAVVDGAEVDASANQAGEIQIGGGQEGQDESIQNADLVYLAEGTKVSADGGIKGDGGRVIVFAEGTTAARGEISARGGSDEGDGGFIETSGLRSLSVGQAPNVGANNGTGGTWLIDPVDIIIDRDDAGNMNVIGDLGAIWANVTPGLAGPLPVPDEQSSFIDLNALEFALSQGNVMISTTDAGGDLNPGHSVNGVLSLGNITFNGDLNFFAENTLTLNADNDIIIDGSIFGSYGSFDFNAGNDILVNRTVGTSEMYGGFIDFEAENNIIITGVLSARETVSLTANQMDVVINRNVGSINSNVYVSAGRDVTLQESIYIGAQTNIDIIAGRDVYAEERSGLVASDTISITANNGDVSFYGIRSSAEYLSVEAGNDIVIDSRNISFDDGIELTAGNDIELRGYIEVDDASFTASADNDILINTLGLYSGDNVNLIANADLSTDMGATNGGVVRVTNYADPDLKYSSTYIRSYNDLNITGDGVDIISFGCGLDDCNSNVGVERLFANQGSGIYLVAVGDVNIGFDDADDGLSISQVTGDINIISTASPFGADIVGATTYEGGHISLVSKYNMTIDTTADINIAAGDSAYLRTLGLDPGDPPDVPAELPRIINADSVNNSILIQAGEEQEGNTSYFDAYNAGGTQNFYAENISVSSGAGRQSRVDISSIGRVESSGDGPYIVENTGEQLFETGSFTIDATATLSSDVSEPNTGKFGSKIDGFEDTGMPFGDDVLIRADSSQEIYADSLSVSGLDKGSYGSYASLNFNATIVSYGDLNISVTDTLTLNSAEILVSTPDIEFGRPVGGGNEQQNIRAGILNSNQGQVALIRGIEDEDDDPPGGPTLRFEIGGDFEGFPPALGQSILTGPPALVDIPSNFALSLLSVDFINSGNLLWQSGNVFLNNSDVPNSDVDTRDATFNNFGRFLINSENGDFHNLSNGNAFTNQAGGTLIKDSGSGLFGTRFRTNILNHGAVIAQTGNINLVEFSLIQAVDENQDGTSILPETVLRGGNINNSGDNAGAFDFQGGYIRGGISSSYEIYNGGVIGADVTVTNTTIDPGFSPGQLTIDGDFDASQGGNTFLIDINNFSSYGGPGSAYDQLVVNGAATITSSGNNGPNNVIAYVDLDFPDQQDPSFDPTSLRSGTFDVIVGGDDSDIDLLPTTHIGVPDDVQATEGLAGDDEIFFLRYDQIEIVDPEPPVIPPTQPEPPVVVEEPDPEPEEPIIEAPMVPEPEEPEIIVIIIDDEPIALPPEIIDVIVSLSDEEREAYLQSERVREKLKTVNMCVGKI